MEKGRNKILLIDDEIGCDSIGAQTLSRIINAFEEANIEVIGTTKGEDAQYILISTPDISCTLVDWLLGEDDFCREAALIDRIRDLRPGMPIFILTDKAEIEEIKPIVLTKVQGYIWKTEDTPSFIVNRIKIAIEEHIDKILPPFFKELKKYTEMAKYSWHTPGHSGGIAFKKTPVGFQFFNFFGENTLRSDLSLSVHELGSLLESTGPVLKAEELAKKVFGSYRTFFVTNGTSTSNKIVFQALIKPGDTVIIDRNCHKSIYHAVIMSGAKPVYLEPTRNAMGIIGTVKLDEIRNKIQANENAKLLVITNPTYDGLIYDIKEVMKITSKNGIKVLVDEAWFGYALFHEQYENRAAMKAARELEDESIEVMAYATQSTHKVLASFSQGSMLHIRDKLYTEHAMIFDEAFMMHTSTSPQYGILASLDVATRMMEYYGKTLVSEALDEARIFREKMKQMHTYYSGKWFRVLNEDELLRSLGIASENVVLDPLKVTITTEEIGVPAPIIAKYLRKRGFQVEKTGTHTFLILFTIGITKGKSGSLIAALSNFDIEVYKRKRFQICPPLPKEIPEISLLPSDAFHKLLDGEYEEVKFEEARGRISACMIVPYPPGIPLLVLGERITEGIAKYLESVSEYNRNEKKESLRIEIHGLAKEKGKEHIYKGIYLLKEG